MSYSTSSISRKHRTKRPTFRQKCKFSAGSANRSLCFSTKWGNRRRRTLNMRRWRLGRQHSNLGRLSKKCWRWMLSPVAGYRKKCFSMPSVTFFLLKMRPLTKYCSLFGAEVAKPLMPIPSKLWPDICSKPCQHMYHCQRLRLGNER